jgi:hypothetical protein
MAQSMNLSFARLDLNQLDIGSRSDPRVPKTSADHSLGHVQYRAVIDASFGFGKQMILELEKRTIPCSV